MNCNTTHYRANSSSVPGDPTLVDSEVRAHAAGRKVDVDALLDGLDRTRFLDDDGEPKSKEIEAWIEKIAPKKGGGKTDTGQGARSGGEGKGTDMTSLLFGGVRKS